MSRWNHAAWLGLLATACSGEEVGVGSEAGQGLDRCGGTADCSASVRSQPVEQDEPGTCPTEPSGQLEIDFKFDVNGRLCAPVEQFECEDDAGNAALCVPEYSGCYTHLKAAKPAPDGSLWVAATASTTGPQDQQALWLGHIGADGSDRGFIKLATGSALRGNTVYYDADIAVDTESHAYVVISGLDPGPNADAEVREHTWLDHYDAQGQRVDGAIDLPGLARAFIAIGDDGRIVIAGDAMNNGKRAIAAVLERGGELVWSQPKVPSAGAGTSGIQGVGVDTDGNVLVYTLRAVSKTQTDYGAVMFDARGTRLWDRLISLNSQVHTTSEFGADAAGNFVALGYSPSDPNPPSTNDTIRLTNANKHGETRWMFDLPYSGAGVEMAVTRESGDVYVAAFKELLHISAEGVCERLTYPADEDARGRTEFAAGHLYFAGGNGVGRYKPLTDD